MPELKDVLNGVLSKTLNIDETGVASLYNEDGTIKDDAVSLIENWDKERIKRIKSESSKNFFDDGYKKAQSEVLGKFESDLKEKFGIKSEKKGTELILDYVQSLKESGVNDDVVKHPLYLTLQERMEQEITKVKSEGEQRLTEFQKEMSRKETMKTVAEKALELFHGLKPVLSSDAIKAKKQEELLIDKLTGFEYELQDGRIVVLKDGKVLEDAHGNRVAFDKIVKELTTTYFDLHVTDPKGSPGNKTGQTKTFNFEVPKNDAEYARVMSDKTIALEERLAIKEAYSKSKN